MKKSIIAVLLLAGLVFAQGAEAGGWSPLQVSVWNPAQAVPEDWNIYGMRLNLLYGRNMSVWGADLGIANTAEKEVCGVQAGLLNGPGKIRGISAGVINSAENAKGLQAGVFNISETGTYGVQLGLILNKSRTMRGLQLGLVNYAEELKGMQLGLVNVVRKNPAPFLPVLQIGF